MTTSRMAQLLRQIDATDPLTALRAVAGVRAELERREAVLVRRARVRGASWSAIAVVLGVSRHALHRKHADGWVPDGGVAGLGAVGGVVSGGASGVASGSGPDWADGLSADARP